MITPAITVLSAVEGLGVATPLRAVHRAALRGDPHRPVLVQKYGTAKIGAFFGPIMVVWFTVLGGPRRVADQP
jgi:KUP system potassium uptake protein